MSKPKSFDSWTPEKQEEWRVRDRESKRRWAVKNADKIKEARKASNTNPDTLERKRVRDREYSKANRRKQSAREKERLETEPGYRERRNAKRREYRERNKDKENEKERERYHKNPEKYIAKSSVYSRRRYHENKARQRAEELARKMSDLEEWRRKEKIRTDRYKAKHPDRVRKNKADWYLRNKTEAAADQFFQIQGAAEQISQAIETKNNNTDDNNTDKPTSQD